MCPTASAMHLHYSSVLLLTQTLVNFSSTVRSNWMSVWCPQLIHQIAHIPLFLYPFLNTTSKTRPFEYLRLTSLGVIGALVKVSALWPCTMTCLIFLEQQNDNNAVIHFLLSTEIIPLCLRIMETGSELSKTVAIFIVQKILLDETGLTYICHTYERFYAVGTVLSNMVNQLVETQAVRLLKHVVRCYLRLSDNLRCAFSCSTPIRS